MKEKRKILKVILMVLVALALVATFAGGYFTAKYQQQLRWRKITEATREGRPPDPGDVGGAVLIQKPTPAPEGEEESK